MAWDFSTEPEFQEKLDWIDEFVRDRGRAARPRLQLAPRLRQVAPGARAR